MVTLRRTQKLARVLPAWASPSAHSDTALGDWYVNRVTVHRRRLLLLVSARGLLPILLPARDVGTLPRRLPEIVEGRLRRLGVTASIARAETSAMVPVVIASTIDRSVLGIMVDFAKAIPFALERVTWDEGALALAEARLAETPCHATRRFEDVVFPDRRAPELLLSRWGAA